MNDLLREHAPISSEAWSEIDAEATRTLKTLLAARRLVDFVGPLGWAAASVPTGRVEKLSPPLQEGAVTRLRDSLPLMELRIPFEISRDELEAIGRGARDANLDSVRNAARAAGIAEDRAVFQGYRPAGSSACSKLRRRRVSRLPKTTRLYLQETFTFRVLTPEASVPLTYPAAKAGKSD